MISPCIDIIWCIAEVEAAHAGFPVIESAHFWIGICKAVEGVDCGGFYQGICQIPSGRLRLRIRNSPGETTVNDPINSCPCASNR